MAKHADCGRIRCGPNQTLPPDSALGAGKFTLASGGALGAPASCWLTPAGWKPARLDVMGGIADYSGATVLELPLALGVWVAAQLGDDGLLAVRTDGPDVPPLARPDVAVPVALLQAGPLTAAPARLRAALAEAGAVWAS